MNGFFRHSSIGFKGAPISRLKKPVTSVPSSGRPSCEITRLTSGTEATSSRIWGAILAALSSETVRGKRRPDPQIPFLERRHELAPQVRDQEERVGKERLPSPRVSIIRCRKTQAEARR